MWCACPTRSPHSPSASSCPKPIPLLNLCPSPAEWAPYPTARTVPRMCERFFCTPAQVPPAFLHRTPTSARTPSAAEPKTRSFSLRSPAFLPRASASVHEVPTSTRTPSAAEPRTRSFSRRSFAFLPRTPTFARQVPTSARTSPVDEPKTRSFSRATPTFPLRSFASARTSPHPSARRAPRRRPRLHRTRHKNAPTLPRLGEKT